MGGVFGYFQKCTTNAVMKIRRKNLDKDRSEYVFKRLDGGRVDMALAVIKSLVTAIIFSENEFLSLQS